MARGRQYYERIAQDKAADWLKVYVEGEYGISFDGRAVFTEFSDAVHTAAETLEAIPRAPVVGLRRQRCTRQGSYRHSGYVGFYRVWV